MAVQYLDKNGLTYLFGKLKDRFQDKLVSGTNIKTINNTSLLGSGDINIPTPTVDMESGEMVSIDDAADAYAVGVTADIEPIQDLHGYDKPWVGGAGKNLLAPKADGTYTNNGVTLKAEGGVYTLSNASTGTWLFDTTINLPIGSYAYALFNGATAGGSIYIMDASSNVLQNISITSANRTGTFTLSAVATTLRIRGTSGNTYSSVKLSPMIVSGSTVPTSFEPYENLCPITGHTEAKVSRTGKNLLPNNMYSSTSKQGITYTYNADGTMTVSGTASANTYQTTSTTLTFPFDVRINGLPEVNGSVVSGTYIQVVTSSGNVNIYSNADTQTITAGTAISEIRLRINNGTAILTPVTFKPMIRLATDTDTSFEPYQGNTYTIDLNGTRYGGTLDVTNGVLTVDRAMYAFNGTENFLKSGSYPASFYMYWASFPTGEGKKNQPFTCSHATMASLFSSYTFGQCYSDSACSLYIQEDTSMTVNGFKAFIADKYNSGNPVQVCYELDTPQTISLTAQQIKLLQGTNNVWTDIGDVSVKYLVESDATDNFKALVRAVLPSYNGGVL